MKIIKILASAFALALVVSIQAVEEQKLPLGEESKLTPLVESVVAPRKVYNLCGEWDCAFLKCELDKFPDPVDRFKTLSCKKRPQFDFNDLEWSRVILPWGMKGLRNDEYLYFRKAIYLPKDICEKRVLFKAEKIIDSYSLIINGRRFPQVTTYELPWTSDITDAMKPGLNEIIIEVANDLSARSWKEYPNLTGYALNGYWGVSRPIHLEIMDKVAIDEFSIVTKVEPKKHMTIDVVITNATPIAKTIRVDASVKGEWNARSEETLLPANGIASIKVSGDWEKAKLWNLEQTHLYFVDLRVYTITTDANGKKEQKFVDAYRPRFGFREITIKGHQFFVNGTPYIHRRNGMGGAGLAPGEKSSAILRLREQGVTGARLFGGDWVRWAKEADEAGAFLTMVSACGWGAAYRTEDFWPRFSAVHEKMVKAFRNHPSVFAWALGNEFGAFYGGDEGGRLEKKAQEHEAAAGKFVGELDPTRAWTYTGEGDVSYPAKGTVGPAPIRSFHYPISTCKNGITFPESGYWYANNELPWQRIITKDKPLVISEDLFHGTQDQHFGLSKVGGDSIWTPEGYAKTLHTIVRSLAEGFYFSGLGGWETWCTFQAEGDKSMLHRLGALTPNYLIATRENYSNIRGGEITERNVYCYNELFTPYDCELIREDTFEGKIVYRDVKKFLLNPGIKHHEKVAIDAPQVKNPSTYEMKLTLKAGDKVLTDRTYVYNIFPKKTELSIRGKVALLAKKESVFRSMKFSRGIFENVNDVIAVKPESIVVDKVLTTEEGRILNDYVLAGGKVLFVEADINSWAPLMLEFKRPFSYAWRRNDDRRTSLIQESWMKAWMPDHTLGDASYPKPQADVSILWDCGQTDGLTNANIMWLNRGKGSWLLCQLPVLSRFAIEPAAPYVLQTVFDEFSAKAPVINGRVVATQKETVGKLLDGLKIKSTNELPFRDDVLVLDASKGLGGEDLILLNEHTKNNGTVLIIEASPEYNKDLYEKMGISLNKVSVAQILWRAPDWWRDGDKGPHWLKRKHNSGIMAGITTEDTYWYNGGVMWGYMHKWMIDDDNRYFLAGEFNPVVSATIDVLNGSKAEVMTEPGGIAVAPFNRGKVVVCTLRFNNFVNAYSQRVGRVLRTLLTNLGAETITPERVHNYQMINISKSMNRGLWHDPVYQKPDGTFDPVGWFGTDNDMRYFPVNLCGWSLVARNFCPKEEFPTEPMNLGGMKFLLTDPTKNNGKGCIVLETNDVVRIQMPKGLKAQKFYFLGAQSFCDKTAKLEMRLSTTKETTVFRGFTPSGCEEFGTCRFACSIKKGVVAWSGPTPKDDQASMYNWFGLNAEPNKEVEWIELKNTSEKDSIAIVAITAELLDE